MLEFGTKWRPVVLGISEEVGVGFCCGFRVFGGKCWDGFGRGRKGKDAGGLGEIGGRIRRDLEDVSGSGLQWAEGEEKCGFSGRERR